MNGTVKKIFAAALVLAAGAGGRGNAGTLPQPYYWQAPLVQKVRIPGRVVNGLYVPEHSEYVLISPGSWKTASPGKKTAPQPEKNTAGPLPGTKKIQPAPETTSFRTVIKKTAPPAPAFLGRKISLNAGEAPLRIVLAEIAARIGRPVITGDGVDPDALVEGNFAGRPAKDVLDDICAMLDYAWSVKDGKVAVSKYGSLTFQIDVPCVTTVYSSSINLSAASGCSTGWTGGYNPYQTAAAPGMTPAAAGTPAQNAPAGSAAVSGPNSSVLIYTDPVSLYKEIKNNLKALVSPDGRYAVNRAAGTVFVYDRVDSLKRIAVYFKTLNKILSREVLVKAKVVEVTLDSGFQSGINWNLISGQTDFHTNFDLITGGPVFVIRSNSNPAAGNTGKGLNALVNLLGSQGKVNVLSEPQATVLNGEPAIIQMADIVSYAAQVSQVITQTGSQTAVTPGQVMQGVNMTIIPKVSGDGIFLNVMPSVTMIKDIRQLQTLDTTIEVPEVSSRALNTSVKIREGDIVAIGGLIYDKSQNQEENVPFLAKIPLLGALFRQKTVTRTKTELLILLTAREVE